jgi:hypothetical protein
MALRHAAALMLCAASIQLAGAPAFAQNAPITNVPIIVIPDALPDLVVIAAQMNLACAADKKSLTATFAVKIQNKGPKVNADLSKITWHIIVDAIAEPTQDVFAEPSPLKPIRPAQGGPKILKPGEIFETNLTIKNVPHLKKSAPASARYALVVRADPTQGVTESNEDNNIARKFFKDPCPL